MVWHGVPWYGTMVMVWFGMAWYGMVWYGMMCRGAWGDVHGCSAGIFTTRFEQKMVMRVSMHGEAHSAY
jgi:hypothetical protein